MHKSKVLYQKVASYQNVFLFLYSLLFLSYTFSFSFHIPTLSHGLSLLILLRKKSRFVLLSYSFEIHIFGFWNMFNSNLLRLQDKRPKTKKKRLVFFSPENETQLNCTNQPIYWFHLLWIVKWMSSFPCKFYSHWKLSGEKNNLRTKLLKLKMLYS